MKYFFRGSFSLSLCAKSEGVLSAVALWFDVTFPSGHVLSTCPSAPDTHWHQTIMFLGCREPLPKGTDVELKVCLSRPSPSARQYDITVET